MVTLFNFCDVSNAYALIVFTFPWIVTVSKLFFSNAYDSIISTLFGTIVGCILTYGRGIVAGLDNKYLKELILENENNRKNNRRNIIIGLSVLALSLFMFTIFLLGTDFAKIIWFIDFPSIIVFMCVLTALSLISKGTLDTVEHCIFPLGVMMSILNMITMLNSAEDIYMKNIAICSLPILYSSVVYVVMQCLKNRKIQK